MPIYTRTGDKGKTSLFDGTRVLKSHQRVDTYGTIDELNSMVGLAIAHLGSKNNSLKIELERIQHDLLDVGSALATPHPMPVIGLEMRPKEFEQLIDKMTNKMPELKHFILPGGSKAGAILHVCRTITRRVERRLVTLIQNDKIDDAIIIYFNRLSDLFFKWQDMLTTVKRKKKLNGLKSNWVNLV